jgi:hypothetical protein
VSRERPRVLLLFARSDANRTLSYQHGWPRHFLAHPRFECTALNLAEGGVARRLLAAVATRTRNVDAIVLLHSVFSNQCALVGPLLAAVQASPAKKAFFVGNEYKLMPEKMEFAASLPTALLVTQSADERVHALYRARLGCAVVGLPNTGLDTALFAPRTPWSERPLALGYRALDGPAYLGHDERREIAVRFREAAARHGLTADLSLDAADRLDESGWAAFLDRCKAQLGTEAGSDRFELDDATRLAVNAHLTEHPAATREAIRARFFADTSRDVPMRILSGRNVEAAGTQTLQLLLDGHYGGWLQPGFHYVAVRKDWSNVDEALVTLRDTPTCERIRNAAYELAVSELTYPKLLDRFADALSAVL